jgi:LacI family transcriptional regulator
MNMTNTRQATMKDVAEAAGVSTAAVSHALRPREGSNIKLQESKIQLIKEHAERLNYRPHAGARSIRSKRFGSIGYFSSKPRNLFYTPFGYQHGVHDALAERGYRITLIRVSDQMDQVSEQIPKAFNELNLDGLIVESYSDVASRIHRIYEGRHFPFMYLNDRHEYNSVFVGEVESARILTRHVLEKGHRKVAFAHRHIEGEPGIDEMHHSARDREAGYRQVMEDSGLVPAVVTVEARSVLGRDVRLSDEQWDKLKGYDAIIAYDDDFANSIAKKCYDLGIRVPDDIGLAGFNGDYASLAAWRSLTTMQIPAYDMGMAIGKMAVDRLEENNGRCPSVRFVPTLLEGDTL